MEQVISEVVSSAASAAKDVTGESLLPQGYRLARPVIAGDFSADKAR